MINNYKHIVWDWNGTLLNDVDYSRKIINRILVNHQLPELSFNRYREVFTFPVQDYYAEAGLDLSKYSFKILGKNFIDDYESNKLSCSLYDNAVEVLSSIHQKGIKQYVISAYLHENLVKILEHYNLSQYFDEVFGLDNVYAGSKTHLGIKLIEQLDVNKKEVLFIGDTLHDADVAEAMGVKSILIADGHQIKEKLMINSNIVYDNLLELKEKLFP